MVDGYRSCSPLVTAGAEAGPSGELALCGHGTASRTGLPGQPLQTYRFGFAATLGPESGWAWRWISP